MTSNPLAVPPLSIAALAGSSSGTRTIGVGSGPLAVAVTPDLTQVYVANTGSHTVSIIDADTDTPLRDPITYGRGPIGVAASTDASTVYVSNGLSGTVSAIDTTSHNTTFTMPAGPSPAGLVALPDGEHLYVANSTLAGTVSVLNTVNAVVEATIGLGSLIYDVAVSQNGDLVYATGDGSLYVIDTATRAVVATIPVGTGSRAVAVCPDGPAYVVNQGADSVSVVDTATNTVTATIPVGANPLDVTFTTDCRFALVTNSVPCTVSVIDVATAAVLVDIAVGPAPVGVAATSRSAYVTNGHGDSVSVIDL
jgi:YVTN family beta-propeller protein